MFNINGNHYRLVCIIIFALQKVYIRYMKKKWLQISVLSHNSYKLFWASVNKPHLSMFRKDDKKGSIIFNPVQTGLGFLVDTVFVLFVFHVHGFSVVNGGLFPISLFFVYDTGFQSGIGGKIIF